MSGGNTKDDFGVIIIGAGTVGLLLAHGLKKRGIKSTIYEREDYLNQRPRDWNFGIYWAQNLLAECLPTDVLERMGTAQVSPHEVPSEKDHLTILNGETGQLLANVPTPKVQRLGRNRLRSLLAGGLDIGFGKRLQSVSEDQSSDSVTATFEDGSCATGNLIVGADGANSRVRNFLLGDEKAALQDLPLMGICAVDVLPADLSKKIREEYNMLSVLQFAPFGLVAWLALHELSDPTKPETWKWLFTFTWNDSYQEQLSDPVQMRKKWMSWAERLAEPFRSVFSSLPEGASIWSDRLSQWPTVSWDNRKGRVTLTGDAAHPMTYHRGQGLNNAVEDAAKLCNALQTHLDGTSGKSLGEAISLYEEEVVKRGYDAVVSSGQNSMMVHDWDQLVNSGVMRAGMKKD